MSDSEGHRKETPDKGWLPLANRYVQRYFRPHLRAFALGAPAILLVDFLVSAGWWFFWPILIWSLLQQKFLDHLHRHHQRLAGAHLAVRVKILELTIDAKQIRMRVGRHQLAGGASAARLAVALDLNR